MEGGDGEGTEVGRGGWRGMEGDGAALQRAAAGFRSHRQPGPSRAGACSLLGKRLVNYCTGVVLAMELQ